MRSLSSLVRAKDWFYFLGFNLLAFVEVRGQGDDPGFFKLFLSAAFAATYLACGYLINNFFDIQEDAAEKNLFSKYGQFSNAHLALCAALTLAMFLLSIWMNLLYETLILFVLNVIYSAPATRIKKYLLPSLILNAVFFTYVYYSSVYYFENSYVSESSMVYAGYLFLLFIPVQYAHFLEHLFSEDQKLSTRHFTGYVLTLIPLCSYVFVFGHHFSPPIQSATLVFSALLAFSLRQTSADQLRSRIRRLSAILLTLILMEKFWIFFEG